MVKISSCLILQSKEKLYIGSDTSSSVFHNNKLYRLNNETTKLFKLDNNTILYCAGNNKVAKNVKDYIFSLYFRNNFSFDLLIEWLVWKYPLKHKYNNKTIFDVEILICTVKNNETVVFQMSQYNNYKLIVHKAPQKGIQILSAGIKNKDCISFAEKELLRNSGIKSIYYNTFQKLSCNYIGGKLDLYEISDIGINTIFNKYCILEKNIQYINNILNNVSVSINAEVLISKIVMSEYLHIENESGTYKFEDSGFTASNGINTIKISPSKDDELFSIYKNSDKLLYFDSKGNGHFKGILDAAEGHFAGLISGGSININDQFIVDSYGNMTGKSGTFSGNVEGASINIGNGYFKVDRETGFVTTNIGTFGGWWIGNGSIVGLGEYKFEHRLTQLDDGTWELKIFEEGWESPNGVEKKIYAEKPNDYEIYKLKEKYMSQYNLRNSFQAFNSKNKCALSIGYSPSSPAAIEAGDAESVGWETGRFVVYQSGKMKCKSIQVENRVYGTSSGTTNAYIYQVCDDINQSVKTKWIPSVAWVKGYVQNNISSSSITANTHASSNGNGNYVQLGSATVATTGWCSRSFAHASEILTLSNRISSLVNRVSALESKIK